MDIEDRRTTGTQNSAGNKSCHVWFTLPVFPICCFLYFSFIITVSMALPWWSWAESRPDGPLSLLTVMWVSWQRALRPTIPCGSAVSDHRSQTSNQFKTITDLKVPNLTIIHLHRLSWRLLLGVRVKNTFELNSYTDTEDHGFAIYKNKILGFGNIPKINKYLQM